MTKIYGLKNNKVIVGNLVKLVVDSKESRSALVATSKSLVELDEANGDYIVDAELPNFFDLLEYTDSYVADVENNLRGDPETWERYENDMSFKIAVLSDMLCDFGKFPNWTNNNPQLVRAVARHAAAWYWGEGL